MPNRKKIQLAEGFFAPAQVEEGVSPEDDQANSHQRSMAIILGVEDGKRSETRPTLEKKSRSRKKTRSVQPSLACPVARMMTFAGRNVSSTMTLMWRFSTFPLRLGVRLFS